MINSNEKLLEFLKEDFRKILNKELDWNQALYREASLQCILYNEIRNKLSPKKYIYPEINYWNYKKNWKSNKADLVILNKWILDIIKEYKKTDKAFNITEFKKENYCESIIELKYKSTLWSIKKWIKEDIYVLNNNWNKIKNKILLFIYEVNKWKEIILEDLLDINIIKKINIIGYTWDWTDLKIIEN